MPTNNTFFIAKKKRTINTYYSVLQTENNIYEIPESLNSIKEYDNNYKLEDDEWFGIENFSDTEYCIPILTQEFNSAEFGQISNAEYKNVKFFCSYQENDFYCFQNFVYSNIISKRWLSLSGEPEIKTDQPILILKQIPDAIFKKSVDTLFFKKLSDINSIFPKTIELYKEATDEETEIFLNNDFINLESGFNKNKVKKANRKRISMAIETLNNLEEEQKSQIHNYIREYCPEINFNDEDNKFSVGNEENLKNLIFGIEQRFYTTIVGDERRLANSISRLPTASVL